MKTATIRELRGKQPFRPFHIHTADGRAVPVITPDHIFIAPTNDEFVVYSAAGDIQILDPSLVTGVTRKSPRSGKTR